MQEVVQGVCELDVRKDGEQDVESGCGALCKWRWLRIGLRRRDKKRGEACCRGDGFCCLERNV